MLEKIKYINHLGEEVNFGADGVYINESDLRDYSWDVNTINNKITSITNGVIKRTLPLQIVCKTEEDGLRIKNKLFEIFDTDVAAMIYGQLVIGDYSMQCFITGSKKSNYLYSKMLLSVEMTVITDKPKWIRKETIDYIYTEQLGNDNGYDFEYDFEYDYGLADSFNTVITNTYFADVDFVINISGYAIDPVITIGDNRYKINNLTIGNQEYLTIDSKEKTITLTKKNGAKVNCFSKRDKANYIFEKIKSGVQAVNWNGQYNWSLTLIEERSEPKWI